MTKRTLLLALTLILAACGSSTGPRKPDPYLVVGIYDGLDPQTTLGQSEWHLYMFLEGPYDAQNGIANRGTLTAKVNFDCVGIVADSVGQRLIQPFAVADTVNKTMSSAEADAVARAWYSGNHTLRSGLVVLTFPQPQDAWDSPRYAAGHGLTRNDPIFWAWNWAASGAMSFSELDALPPGCPSDIF